MAEHLTIPGALEWDTVERHSIATLRYAGGKEHDVKYVSEVAYDALAAELKSLTRTALLPIDWEDQLLSEMVRRFDLRKHLDDDHLVYDDTQVGVEFACNWIKAIRRQQP